MHNNARACRHHTHSLFISRAWSHTAREMVGCQLVSCTRLCFCAYTHFKTTMVQVYLLSHGCRLSKQCHGTALRVSKSHRRVAHVLKDVHKGAVAVVHSVLESVLRSVCAPGLLCQEASSILRGSLVLLGMCRFSGNSGCF